MVAWRWHLRSGGQPHRLPARLIVSLTSYPPRFGTLVHSLRSLLLQTVKADRTILWIAHRDLPLLPADVVGIQAAGLEIRATDDLRSYKKIIPALDAFPDAFICTADDDQYYRPSWLEELIAVARGDRVVTCHRAHEITFDAHGVFNPYNQWVLDTRRRGTMRALFPNGAGRAVIRRAFWRTRRRMRTRRRSAAAARRNATAGIPIAARVPRRGRHFCVFLKYSNPAAPDPSWTASACRRR